MLKSLQMQEHLAMAYCFRAQLRYARRDEELQEDLGRAWQISSRYGLRLTQVDCLLTAAELGVSLAIPPDTTKGIPPQEFLDMCESFVRSEYHLQGDRFARLRGRLPGVLVQEGDCHSS
jgi:hypothetical protein